MLSQVILVGRIKEIENIESECVGFMGGLIFKKDKDFIFNTFLKHDEEMTNALENDNEFLKNALKYELRNHEYIITHYINDTLRALGLSKQFFENSVEKCNILNEPIKEMEVLGC